MRASISGLYFRELAAVSAVVLAALIGCGNAQDGTVAANGANSTAPPSASAVVRVAQAKATDKPKTKPAVKPAAEADDEGPAVREVAKPDALKAGAAARSGGKEDPAEAAYEVAIEHAKAGRVKPADDAFTEALRLREDFPQCIKDYGIFLMNRNDVMKATQLYSRGLELRPNDSDLHNSMGVVLTRTDDEGGATKHFKEAIRLDPENADAQFNMGVLYFNQGDPDRAIAQYKEALRLRPSYLSARFSMGRAYLHKGNAEEARVQFSEIVKVNRDFADAYYLLGKITLELAKSNDDLNRAILELTQALRVNGGHVEARYEMGALAELKRDDLAIAQFRSVLRSRPDHSDANYQLALALERKGLIKEALAHNHEALRLRPLWPEVLNNYAWLLATSEDEQLRSPTRAVDLAEQARDLAEYKMPRVYDTLAAAYAAAGRFADAEKTAAQALVMARASGQDSLAADIEARITAYKAGKTPTDAATTPTSSTSTGGEASK